LRFRGIRGAWWAQIGGRLYGQPGLVASAEDSASPARSVVAAPEVFRILVSSSLTIAICQCILGARARDQPARHQPADRLWSRSSSNETNISDSRFFYKKKVGRVTYQMDLVQCLSITSTSTSYILANGMWAWVLLVS
jgi:hypothetical protein